MKRSGRAIAAIFGGAMVLTLAGPAAAGDLKTFKDWIVGCDQANSCKAIGLRLDADNAFAGAYLVVGRPAGADGKPTVAVVVLMPEDKGEPTGLTLAVDGKDLTETLAVETTDYSVRATVDPADVPAVIEAARSATRLTARLSTSGGDSATDISLAGSTAALLYIDDIQGRVGTLTALARSGKTPAAAVPPAPDLPVVAAMPIAIATVDGPPPAGVPAVNKDDCDGPDPYLAFTLGTEAELWGVCTSAGAYNFFYDFYLVRGGKAEPAPMPPGSEAGAITLVNPWVTEAGTLGAFFRGRGVGDCGELTDYAFDGTRFVTVSRALMPDCRGVDSADWPVLDRALLR